jgi:hypothetical protein
MVPIPAVGQPKRSHPIRVPGDGITPRIRRCHVPNKDILITHTVGRVILIWSSIQNYRCKIPVKDNHLFVNFYRT